MSSDITKVQSSLASRWGLVPRPPVRMGVRE